LFERGFARAEAVFEPREALEQAGSENAHDYRLA
jgi:hypothetical protein